MADFVWSVYVVVRDFQPPPIYFAANNCVKIRFVTHLPSRPLHIATAIDSNSPKVHRREE